MNHINPFIRLSVIIILIIILQLAKQSANLFVLNSRLPILCTPITLYWRTSPIREGQSKWFEDSRKSRASDKPKLKDELLLLQRSLCCKDVFVNVTQYNFTSFVTFVDTYYKFINRHFRSGTSASNRRLTKRILSKLKEDRALCFFLNKGWGG